LFPGDSEDLLHDAVFVELRNGYRRSHDATVRTRADGNLGP
jgi:hypothetical protein